MTKPIEIEVDQDGNFTYHPALLRAQVGASIGWTCGDGIFTVRFAEGSPFDQIDFYGSKSGGGGRRARLFSTRFVKATRAIKGKVYHYHVAVERPDSNGNPVIYIDSGCPGVCFP